MTKLSVNLNKVALLRNSRGAHNPSPLVAAKAVLDAGADGITLHWRSDNRHTRKDDVVALRELCAQRGVEFNLEGDARGELVELALELRVSQFTLVPVTPGEVTSDHGWRLPHEAPIISPIIARMKTAGIRTAIFMDAHPEAMALASQTGTDRVELYTEPYAAAFGTAGVVAELARLVDTVHAAKVAGLGVNAGHDLNLANLPTFARALPDVAEVSIGHALVADALYLGFGATIARYVTALRGESVQVPVTC